MMGSTFNWVVIVLSIFILSCENQVNSVGPREAANQIHKPSQKHTINAVLWHQTAAEYKALCYQTYNLAKIQLKLRLQHHAFPYDLPPAIVMDLDETVVDNSFFNAQLILDSTNYNRDRWMEWSNLMNAGEVPGALEFIAFTKDLGVKVLFVSNRRVAELQNTMENLKKLGVTDLDSNQFYLRVDEGSKKSRREEIAINHEIIMFFGDNLSDFSSIFDKQDVATRNNLVDSLSSEFGSRFIVLPNVLYGDWESALYGFEYSYSESQKDSIQRVTLRGY